LSQYLCNIELYYTLPKNISENRIIIEGEEYSHIIKVMRHTVNDELFVCNGEGKVFAGRINKINKNNLELAIANTLSYENKLKNIFFCIPKLRNNDRFEFALEKCTELGITNFLVFESERTISKRHTIERWNKILLSAMKQSLNSFLPKIDIIDFDDISNLPGIKIGLEQSSPKNFSDFKLNLDIKYYFIFGPEGGLSEKEMSIFEKENVYKIANNRLRTETALVTAASLIIGNKY
jgi:16S rRNA (uracil1498-N3)-methyltransferase